jgi:quercetin dioxygenase-like cupin family protein
MNPDIHKQDLITTTGLIMYRHELARGTSMTKHTHEYDHVSILAKGVAIVEQGESRVMHYSGDSVVIVAHIPHTVHAIDDVVCGFAYM